ncbi:MAG: alpha/beta hydrolase [Solirubrobacteraceae bacterium]|nr:alpha/beta hydrolase [Solirubrobacteraceae bacterium]
MSVRFLLAVLAAAAVTALGSAAPASAARPTPQVVPGSALTGDAAFLGPVHRVPANGIQIGYRRFGRGPDLLLITGDTAPMSLWMPYMLAPLAERFRVTIFDNRGVGYTTDDPSVRLSVPLMARDTAALIEALGLRRPTVVGWSMGGEIALTMGALRIGRIGRIVTSGGDAGSRHTIPPPPGLIKALADPQNVQAALDIMFPGTPAGQAAQARFIQAYLATEQETVSQQTLDRQAAAEQAFLRSDRVWKRLERIRVPTLITNGALDPAVPAANARRLARRIPGARLSVYEGAAHGMMFQDAERFAAEVARFAGR